MTTTRRPRLVALSSAAKAVSRDRLAPMIESAGRRHRQVAEDAPRAEVVDELEGRGLVGVDQPLVLVGDALAERVRARRLAQDDGAVAVRDRDLGALDDAALLQALAQPADVEMGDDGAAELALRRERDRDRQRRLVGAGKRREHADGEALAAEHVAEIAAGVVALGVAPGRRLAGDPSADVEHRQRDEVRQRGAAASKDRPGRGRPRPRRRSAHGRRRGGDSRRPRRCGRSRRRSGVPCAASSAGSRPRRRGATQARNAPG